MGPTTDLNLFKERAAAVRIVISEINDMAGPFDYAATLTKMGGRIHGGFRLARPGPGDP
jgi:hypothetical protein